MTTSETSMCELVKQKMHNFVAFVDGLTKKYKIADQKLVNAMKEASVEDFCKFITLQIHPHKNSLEVFMRQFCTTYLPTVVFDDIDMQDRQKLKRYCELFCKLVED